MFVYLGIDHTTNIRGAVRIATIVNTNRSRYLLPARTTEGSGMALYTSLTTGIKIEINTRSVVAIVNTK
jgi:hypothetical protein